MREEQFGPVIPVLAYDGIDEVIARANDSEYGLGGAIWTGDIERGIRDRPADRQRHRAGRQASRTAGGHTVRRRQPVGSRPEKGVDGLKEFTQAKIVDVAKLPLVL